MIGEKMKTKEENYIEAFDAWGDAKKKLEIKKATYEEVTHPLRRNPQGNELMRGVFYKMLKEIEILRDREEEANDKVRKSLISLKEIGKQ